MQRLSSSFASGFTLIEVILYLGIVSIFMVGMTTFAWDVIYGREKATLQLEVEQSARMTMSRIAYETRRAKDFNLVSASEVQLNSDTGTTTISLNVDSIQLDGVDLTSNQIRVTDFVLTDLSAPGSKQLGVELSVEAVTTNQRYQTQLSLSQSVELNTQFSQSRSLLVDLSGVSLSPNNRSIEGIRLENTGENPAVIDQIKLSWSGTAGGENLTAIQINGGTEEWSGSTLSDSVIDIADVTLAVGESVDIDYLRFDDKIDGGSFVQVYVLVDESSLPTRFEVIDNTGGGPPSPSPSPTPAPTPSPTSSPTSCTTYCQSQGYSSGNCDKNAGQCNRNDQTHLDGGDSFCTGGPNTDTCCCIL